MCRWLGATAWRSRLLKRGIHVYGVVCSISTTTEVAKARRPFVPSSEQQAIVKLSQKQNVVVSARPGAGKTATAEAIVAANPDHANLHSARASRKNRKRQIDPAVDGTVTIWEIKFVAQLSLEHIIQACIYAYLWSRQKKQSGKLAKIILFNVKNGEKLEITPQNGIIGLRNVMEGVLTAKYTGREILSEEQFLKRCAETSAEADPLAHPRNVTP